MTFKIRKFGDPVLRQTGNKVLEFNEELVSLSKQMLETMHDHEGIGLAAQQIGKAIQFCVMDVPEHPEYPMLCLLDGKQISSSLLMPLSLANPRVEELPGDEYYYEEGCLSFPGINADIARPDRIVVHYQDLDGANHSLECDGLLARCIQHEVDHLNGILYIDRMEKKTFAEIKKEVQTLKKDTTTKLKNTDQGKPSM